MKKIISTLSILVLSSSIYAESVQLPDTKVSKIVSGKLAQAELMSVFADRTGFSECTIGLEREGNKVTVSADDLKSFYVDKTKPYRIVKETQYDGDYPWIVTTRIQKLNNKGKVIHEVSGKVDGDSGFDIEISNRGQEYDCSYGF